MNAVPHFRQRALLPGISASTWANYFALSVIGFILSLVLLGLATQPWLVGQVLARPLSVAFAAIDTGLLVVSGVMVFVRLTAERAQGYTTIDGFRLGRNVSMMPGTPDVVDTVESRTGLVLRDAGDLSAPPDVIAARLHEAKLRIRAGERPIMLDPRPRR